MYIQCLPSSSDCWPSALVLQLRLGTLTIGWHRLTHAQPCLHAVSAVMVHQQQTREWMQWHLRREAVSSGCLQQVKAACDVCAGACCCCQPKRLQILPSMHSAHSYVCACSPCRNTVFTVTGSDGAAVTQVCRGVTYNVEVRAQTTYQHGAVAARRTPGKLLECWQPCIAGTRGTQLETELVTQYSDTISMVCHRTLHCAVCSAAPASATYAATCVP